MPGTLASLAGILVYYLVKDSNFTYLLVTGLTIILGFLVSGRLEKILGKKDCPCIVIDEVSGMLLSLAFLPYDLRLVIIGFITFRILDILKPWPLRAIQNLKGSLGIMGDDIAAALYTNIILQVFLRLATFKAS